ncbi:MAG: M3 family metallopeptidase [Cardiobacteriaceae bacterium]|nr:M3 family metallopeptidase [Cardiobacteriaceae bacterium]
MSDIRTNPLYHPAAIPDFAAITPEHASAIPQIISENRTEIENLLAHGDYSWDGLIMPLERMENRLAKAVSPISHLHAVISTDEWRAAYEALLPELTAYSSDLGQNQALYQAIKTVRDSNSYTTLSPAQQKTINDALKNFERSGVALNEENKARFKANNLRLAELSTQYANHVLDATNAWSLNLSDDSRLSGVPENIRALLANLAQQHGQEGYRLTLDAPVVTPLLTYADDRELRATLYRAYSIRASELADNGQYDNSAIISEILDLRDQQAKLLGFPDYAAYSVDNKMAQDSNIVLNFLEDLVAKGKSAGEADMRALHDYAAQTLGLNNLAPWDIAYASEKLRQSQYALSQEDLRPYFPLSSVLQGMFSICQALFGVDFRENPALPVWHADARAYDMFDANGNLRAHFYLDPYARAKKRGGAWMDIAVSRMRDGNTLQLPVAYLVCNFTPPVDETDACLTHKEVTTLFHEFGHGLHHLLTTIDVYSVSGLNGVEWDAVEQPSQFMENFCYDYDCLQRITRHKDSGEPLPTELYEKLIAAKNFQSAMSLLRQMEFSLFDFRLHRAESRGKNVLDVYHSVRDHVSVTPAYPDSRFPMQFSHIFAGGYAAGYYSYKWAEVLSADNFSAFEEEGVLNPATGARFRDEILAVGASRPSMDSFIAFRGRKPDVSALLRHSGIQA